MNSLILTPFRCSHVLLITALFISGCSSSGDSTSDGSQSTSEVSGIINGDAVNADDGDTGSANNAANLTSGEESAEDANSATESDSATSDNGEAVLVDTTDASEDETIAPVDLNTENSSSVGMDSTEMADSTDVPDPMFQNRTQVDFVITVPVYQSSALQVRLNWGELDMTASWVGDELWSASAELPTDTEQTLDVTFYDNNGALELAGFEQTYRTGDNAFETYTIEAEQFNAQLFDADEDGINNLEELLAETDPMTNEDSLLEIRDSFILHERSRMSVSNSFESRVSEERPFSDTYELDPDIDYPSTISLSGSVAISEYGNGTLYYYSVNRPNTLSLSGTRSAYENSIVWVASRNAYDGDYSHSVDVTNTVTVLDETSRSFVEELTGRYSGTYTDTWETNSNLIGELIEGTSRCKPVSGTATLTYRTSPGSFEGITTVSKTSEDLYWRVTIGDSENITSEYFARELVIHGLGLEAGSPKANFLCDFVDF